MERPEYEQYSAGAAMREALRQQWREMACMSVGLYMVAIGLVFWVKFPWIILLSVVGIPVFGMANVFQKRRFAVEAAERKRNPYGPTGTGWPQ